MRFANRLRFAAPALLLSLGACLAGPVRRTASVVDYLYPDRSGVVVSPSVPTLSLPLRVGIAFVPTNQDPFATANSIPATDRQKLLDDVAAHFRSEPYVKSIEVIPASYLTPRGGFTNVDQLRSMFGIDVIALVSYDQTQFSNSGTSSLTYWTLVGAYVVKGEKNDTRTLLDAAVFDIPSRTLLFRAPGVSSVKASTTPINLLAQLREDQLAGFRLAAADMTKNLETELASFRQRVKEGTTTARVVETQEYQQRTAGRSGGGSADLVLVIAASSLAVAGIASRRRR